MTAAIYLLTVKHDRGKIKIRTAAQDEASARHIVETAERCPPSAIIACKLERVIWEGVAK